MQYAPKRKRRSDEQVENSMSNWWKTKLLVIWVILYNDDDYGDDNIHNQINSTENKMNEVKKKQKQQQQHQAQKRVSFILLF